MSKDGLSNRKRISRLFVNRWLIKYIASGKLDLTKGVATF